MHSEKPTFAKSQQRKALRVQVDEYLAHGGRINKHPIIPRAAKKDPIRNVGLNMTFNGSKLDMKGKKK